MQALRERGPGPAKDLAGLGIADAGEKARIRPRALRGVILFQGASGELYVIAGEDFQASWVHGLQRRLPFDDVQ